MSKIGKKPILIENDVKVELSENKIVVEGPKGRLERIFPKEIKVEKKEKELLVTFHGSKEKKAFWGSWQSHIANMIQGVKHGFEKSLKIEGVGWRANLEGEKLVLKVGFSHLVKLDPPKEIKFTIEKNIIKVEGADKEKVGNTAAKIRAVFPPEP